MEIIELALGRFTDWPKFESLALEIMRGEGYPDIKPLGGMADEGRDAEVERLYLSEGRRSRVVFQFTLQEDTTAKLRDTVSRLDAAGINYNKLIFVTRAEVTTETQTRLKRRFRDEQGVELEFFERRTIVLRLGDIQNGLWHRFFPDVVQQAKRLAATKPDRSESVAEREMEFLKICCAFTLSPRASHSRHALLDETVLAIVSTAGASATSVDRIIALGRSQLHSAALVEPSQVQSCLDRLVRRGSVRRLDSGFVLADSETARIESAQLGELAREQAVVEDLVQAVEEAQGRELDDYTRRQLANNAGVLLAEYFRLNGLELAAALVEQRPTAVYFRETPSLQNIACRNVSPELGSLLCTAISTALASPSAEQAALFARRARSYIALQVLNVDPGLRELQATRFKTKVFLLDTDFVLEALIREHPRCEVYRKLVAQLQQLGATVAIPDEVAREVVTHLQIAPRTFDYFGGGLGRLGIDVATARVGNALVLGYWYLSRDTGETSRDGFFRYRDNYFDDRHPMEFVLAAIRDALPRCGDGAVRKLLDVEIPNQLFERVMPIVLDRACKTPKGRDRTQEQNEDLARHDTELLLGVSTHNKGGSNGQGSVLGSSAYLVTGSARFLRAAEVAGLDDRVSTRPQILSSLLELMGALDLSDLQYTSLLENCLLHSAAEAVWDDVKVLLDAGLELGDKSLTRLRFDVEDRLHDQITALRNADSMADADDSDEPPEAGDREHLELLKAADRAGYRANQQLMRLLAEGRANQKELTRLAEENQALREAVSRFGKRKARYLRQMQRRGAKGD